jgi:hypothetical protein
MASKVAVRAVKKIPVGVAQLLDQSHRAKLGFRAPTISFRNSPGVGQPIVFRANAVAQLR